MQIEIQNGFNRTAARVDPAGEFRRTNLYDFRSELMTENPGILKERLIPLVGMEICPAHPHSAYAYQRFTWSWFKRLWCVRKLQATGPLENEGLHQISRFPLRHV